MGQVLHGCATTTEAVRRAITGLTPYEFICKIWTKEPERFTLDPLHKMPGLNTILFG